jgi:excisionase family DNA binding protein
MKYPQSTNFTDLSQEHHSDVHREAYIKSFSQRTGEQAGQLIGNFLDGILFLFLAERSPRSVRSPVVTPGSELSPAFSAKADKLLTAYEIAFVLSISKAKAYRLIQEGKIPAVQFDRTTRVRRQDLDEFIKGHLK